MSAIPVKDTLKYLNEARTNPSGFAQHVKKEIDLFVDDSKYPLFPGYYFYANEGKSAWVQAYNFLLNQEPLPPYELNQGLCLAAEDHAIDMEKNNFFSHSSSNGAWISDRITRRCGQAQGYFVYGENIGNEINIEGRNHALQTIVALIIDDGTPCRGHRKNVFSNDFKYVGINSKVQENRIITVIDFHTHNLPTKNGGNLEIPQITKGDHNGGNRRSEVRCIVSKSINFNTSTINGVTKTVTVTKIKYSDETEQVLTEETINK